MKVTDILTQEALNSFCTNALWSSDLRIYLSGNSDMMWMHIGIYYKDLYAIDFPETHPSWIGTYLFKRLQNEFERIFVALTWQYKPYYNYYRSIIEENSGSDTHTYTGTDTERLSGTDSYSGSYNETTNQKTMKPTEDLSYSSTYDDTNVQTMKPTTKSTEEYEIQNGVSANYQDSTAYGKTSNMTYGKILDMDFGRRVDTTIEGLNGLFAPQDLIMKELVLRIRAKLFDIFVTMIVQCVSAGVWADDE